MTDIYVNSFTHLEDKYDAAKALHMLKRIASLVKPIMKKRSWVLPLLSEFFPDNPNLLGLNVNSGEQILLRLRASHSPDTLLQEEQVIETMLHELTHNVHGPHDDAFYKYLTGLQDEFYALKSSGHDADGFLSTGRMLVSSPYHDSVPPNVARVRALEAAEKRAKSLRIVSGGGRLGGSKKTQTNLSPRELAARAAERRLRDDKSCGASVDVKGEVERAKKDSIETKVIDLTLDDEKLDGKAGNEREKMESIGTKIIDPTLDEKGPYRESKTSDSEVIIVRDVHPVPKSKATINATAGTPNAKTLTTPQAASSSSRRPLASKKSSQGSKILKTPILKKAAYSTMEQKPPEGWGWPCGACTVINKVTAVECEVCATPKPQVKLNEKKGWRCATCKEGNISPSLWTCVWCGEMKLTS